MGIFYLVRGLFRGVVGFQLSYIIRINLKYAGLFLLGNPTLYHTVLTAHAFVIIFFSIMPILIGGLGNFLVPLIVFKNDIDLPNFNSYSFWVTVPALLLLLGRAFLGRGAATSWTVYPPLREKTYHSAFRVDSAIFSLHLAGIRSLVSRINFLITIVNRKRRRRQLVRFPLVLWCLGTTALLLILSLPVLAGGITLLLIRRNFRGSYFDTFRGGDPVLFQHLF